MKNLVDGKSQMKALLQSVLVCKVAHFLHLHSHHNVQDFQEACKCYNCNPKSPNKYPIRKYNPQFTTYFKNVQSKTEAQPCCFVEFSSLTCLTELPGHRADES